MQSRFMEGRRLEVLTAPRRWTILAPCLGDSPGGSMSARHVAWYRQHRQSHSQRELLIGLKGASCYGVGEGGFGVRPGTILFINSMEAHQVGYPPFEADVEHLWISLLDFRCTAWQVSVQDGRMVWGAGGTVLRDLPEAATRLMTDLIAAHPGENAGLQRVRLHALVSLTVASLLEQDTHSAGPAPAHKQERIVQTIQSHIRQTAGRGDSLESLARIAGYSPCHFLRVFKAHAGVTVQSYIDQCRRAKVMSSLEAGISKKEIAYDLGFASPQSFSRWLRFHGRV
jgi:AraC-like DNA-binding protein